MRRELLTVEADPRSPELGQYAFVQALIREVAYNTLAKRDRKVRHLAAARFFEGLGSDELAGALAGHYLAAHDSAQEGAEADALAVQARIALSAAAERAAALGSHVQAVTFLKQALTVTTDPAEEAALLGRAGDSAASAALHDVAEDLLGGALTLRRALGERPAIAQATAALATERLNARRTSDAATILEPAVIEFGDLGVDAALVALRSQLSRVYFFLGENQRAVEMADRALEVAEHADLLPLLADTLVTKGSSLANLGRLHEGIGVIEIGERLARSNGYTNTLLRALNNRSASQGEIDPAANLEALVEGLALARRIGQRYWTFGFVVGVGYYCFLFGDWERAAATLAQGLADDPEPEDRLTLLSNAVLIPALRGEPVDDTLAELTSLTGDSSDPQMLSQLHDARGNAELAAFRLAAAREEFEHSAAFATGLTMTMERAYAARAALWDRDAGSAAKALAGIDASGLQAPTVEARRSAIGAGIAAIDGRQAEALGLYRDALRRWRDLGFVLDEAFTTLDMALLLDPTEPEVAAAASAGRDIFVRLGMRPFIDRLDEAMTRDPVAGAATRD